MSTVLLLLPLNDQEDGAAPDGERDGRSPTNDTSPADVFHFLDVHHDDDKTYTLLLLGRTKTKYQVEIQH